MLGFTLRAMLFPQGVPGVPREEGTAGTAHPKCSSASALPLESSSPTAPLSVQASGIIGQHFALSRFAAVGKDGESRERRIRWAMHPEQPRHSGVGKERRQQHVPWEQSTTEASSAFPEPLPALQPAPTPACFSRSGKSSPWPGMPLPPVADGQLVSSV